MKAPKQAASKVVARINNVDIVILNQGKEVVPLKPICEALGIAWQSQHEKLKSDGFLSSVISLSVTTGSDGKRYEMVCLPYRYVFGWLFTINPQNVKPEAQDAVKRYRIECYNALFMYFTVIMDFIKRSVKPIHRFCVDGRNCRSVIKLII